MQKGKTHKFPPTVLFGLFKKPRCEPRATSQQDKGPLPGTYHDISFGSCTLHTKKAVQSHNLLTKEQDVL